MLQYFKNKIKKINLINNNNNKILINNLNKQLMKIPKHIRKFKANMIKNLNKISTK